MLDHFCGDNPGTLKNLSVLFSHGALKDTGKLFIYAVDQGFEIGPDRSFLMNPMAYDPSYHFQLAIEAGCCAIAASATFIRSCIHDFIGKIPIIVKLNGGTRLSPEAPYQAITASVDEALRLGACAIGFTIYPGSSFTNQMNEEAAAVAEEAKQKGLGVIIWAYPRGEAISQKGQQAIDVVGYATQIACQLGAHIVKVKMPTTYIEFEDLKDRLKIKTKKDLVENVVRCAFNGKRLVIFSGGETKDDDDFLDDVKAIYDGGGSGSIIGRNFFQRSRNEALKLARSIIDIYKC